LNLLKYRNSNSNKLNDLLTFGRRALSFHLDKISKCYADAGDSIFELEPSLKEKDLIFYKQNIKMHRSSIIGGYSE